MQNTLRGALGPGFPNAWDVMDRERPHALQRPVMQPAPEARGGSGARYTRAAFITAGFGMMAGGIALTTLGFMGCFGKGPMSDHGRDLCSNMAAYDPYSVTQPKPKKGETEPTGLQFGAMIGGPIMAVLGVILASVGCCHCCFGHRNAARDRGVEMPPVDARLG